MGVIQETLASMFQNVFLGTLLIVRIYATIIRGMFHFFIWKPVDTLFYSAMNLANRNKEQHDKVDTEENTTFSKRLLEVSTRVQQLGDSIFQTVDAYKWTWLAYFAFVVFINISLIIASILSYAVLYYNFMPDVNQLEVPLYFDFDRSKPVATVDFSDSTFFYPGQQYDVVLELDLPESEVNKQIGMFMVNIDCLLMDRSQVKSGRGLMLRYKSPLFQTISTIAHTVPLLFGFSEEHQIIQTSLFDEFSPNHPVKNVTLQLSSPYVQIYSAKLSFQVILGGIRYLVYRWFLSSFIVGTSMLYCLYAFMAVVLILWFWISSSSTSEGPTVSGIESDEDIFPEPSLQKDISIQDNSEEEEDNEEDEDEYTYTIRPPQQYTIPETEEEPPSSLTHRKSKKAE
mmetsp:Transcript_11186/g.15450  ORF Transcript_11186/g.15450 Transcript_11186/m.15450 type:complete len:399 (+) Transcript_11186:58-1254(+)